MDAWQALCESMGTRCSYAENLTRCDEGVTKGDRCAKHQRNTLRGTVTAGPTGYSPYFYVHCPDAPGHLRDLNLIAGQMAGAGVGDHVVLEYQITSSSGLWNVIEVQR